MIGPQKGEWCVTEDSMKLLLDAMKGVLNEKLFRILEGGFASMLGYGGQDAIHRITGSACTIRRRTQEVLQIAETGACGTPNGRVQKEGDAAERNRRALSGTDRTHHQNGYTVSALTKYEIRHGFSSDLYAELHSRSPSQYSSPILSRSGPQKDEI